MTRLPLSRFSELPEEVTKLLLTYLDVQSLLGLSQVNSFFRRRISEDDFKASLAASVPWFEPHTSQFETYKDCCLEHLRRLNGGKFAPTAKLLWMDVVMPIALPSEPSLKSLSKYVDLLQHREADNSIYPYTSKYGICVNLSSFRVKSAPDLQYTLSLPHLFATIIGHKLRDCFEAQLLLQYKDEPEPHLICSLPPCLGYQMFYCGRHVFVSTQLEDVERLYLVSDSELVEIVTLDATMKPVGVHNGYIVCMWQLQGLFFIQADTQGEALEYDMLTEYERVNYVYGDVGEPGYMVMLECDTLKYYLWNMARGTASPVSDTTYPLHTADVPICLSAREGTKEEAAVRTPFALFASLHHLAGRTAEVEQWSVEG